MRAILLTLCFIIGLFLQTACNTNSVTNDGVGDNPSIVSTEKARQPVQPASAPNADGTPVTTKSKGRPTPKKSNLPPKSTKERLTEKADKLAKIFCACKVAKEQAKIDICRKKASKMSDRAMTYLADSLRNDFRAQYEAQIKVCK